MAKVNTSISPTWATHQTGTTKAKVGNYKGGPVTLAEATPRHNTPAQQQGGKLLSEREVTTVIDPQTVNQANKAFNAALQAIAKEGNKKGATQKSIQSVILQHVESSSELSDIARNLPKKILHKPAVANAIDNLVRESCKVEQQSPPVGALAKSKDLPKNENQAKPGTHRKAPTVNYQMVLAKLSKQQPQHASTLAEISEYMGSLKESGTSDALLKYLSDRVIGHIEKGWTSENFSILCYEAALIESANKATIPPMLSVELAYEQIKRDS